MTADAVSTYARRQRDRLASAAEAARAGDADAIHDMRVAVRRLRSTLRTFRARWDRAEADRVRADLSWLADRLGAVRDGQVLAGQLARAVRAEPPELVLGPVAARLDGTLAARTAEEQRRLAEALDGDRCRRLRSDLDALLDREPRRRSKGWVRKRTRKALRRADRLLDRALDSPQPADADLHRARRAYKRARYAVEVTGEPRAKRLAKRLAAVQDVLGAHQDAVVAGGLLREQGIRAHLSGENGFSYGLLHARRRAAGEAALSGLAKAVRRARKGQW